MQSVKDLWDYVKYSNSDKFIDIQLEEEIA